MSAKEENDQLSPRCDRNGLTWDVRGNCKRQAAERVEHASDAQVRETSKRLLQKRMGLMMALANC